MVFPVVQPLRCTLYSAPCTCSSTQYADHADPHQSAIYDSSWQMQPYSSLRASSFLFSLSSYALVFFGPHFALRASVFCLSSSFTSSVASQHILTKKLEQLNFLASFTAVHVKGSALRNLYISAISASVRWCFTPMSLNFAMTGGSREDVVSTPSDARSCFRLSSFGRNMEGVWSTDGADEGGLKIM